jgi:hypothetical protein
MIFQKEKEDLSKEDRYVPYIRHKGEVFIKVKCSARRWIVER